MGYYSKKQVLWFETPLCQLQIICRDFIFAIVVPLIIVFSVTFLLIDAVNFFLWLFPFFFSHFLFLQLVAISVVIADIHDFLTSMLVVFSHVLCFGALLTSLGNSWTSSCMTPLWVLMRRCHMTQLQRSATKRLTPWWERKNSHKLDKDDSRAHFYPCQHAENTQNVNVFSVAPLIHDQRQRWQGSGSTGH